jgi:hypothetical protein
MALVGATIFFMLPGAAQRHLPPSPVRPRLHEAQTSALGKLPLSFEANRGQTSSQVMFLARGEGYKLFLTSGGGVVLDLAETKNYQPGEPAVTSQLSTGTTSKRASALLGLSLVGANTAARGTGATKLPGKSNYLFGRARKDWHTNIPNYSKVSYSHIYPGINLTYKGNQQQLEYDFVIAPGADPNLITFDLTGADTLDVDAEGNLVLRIAGRQIVQRKPSIYQQARGARQVVAGSYIVKENRQVSFAVGSYDRTRALMIDPVLVYATYLGGGSSEQGTSVAVDAAGVAYVSGITTSADFPALAGPTLTRGGSDIFVTKLNAAGTALEYSTYLGGSNDDESLGLSLDRAGNIYVTGSTNSSDFPATANASQPTLAGGTDAFVAKLNPSGSGLVYSTYLGGSGDDEGFGIATDAASNAYVVGVTDSTNFPTANPVQATKNAGSDVFLSKLNATGTTLSYSTYLGGNGTDWGFGLAVDAGGNAYLAGITNSTNFPVTPNVAQLALKGPMDGFVTKLNTSVAPSSQFVYSTYLGGSGLDGCFGLTTDQAGNAYVTGITLSPDFPVTTGSLQPSLGGISDAFVSKLNPTGTSLTYTTYLGGGGIDWGYGIALDPAANAYVIGSTESGNFPITPGAFQTAAAGGSDAFVSKLNPAGAALAYGSYFGGNSHEDGFGIALDSAANAYITGTTYSTNFPALVGGGVQSSLRGGMDAFVAKISTSCGYTLSIPAQSFTSAGGEGGVSITTAGGCGWTASSNSEWITINANSNHDGSASISYTVAANTGTARVGALIIAGQSFVVTQAAASGCGAAAIHPTIRPFGSAGGNGQLTVVAPNGCSWSVASNNSWLTLAGSASGVGTGRVRYTVAANPSAQTRIGTLSVAGQVYRVTQTGIGAASFIQFNAANTQTREDDASGTTSITLTRTGDTSGAATVVYATVDNPAAVPCNPAQTSERGTAYARCDYATSIDTVTFAPGETSKSFTLSLTNDIHVEGHETFQVVLTSPQGATLGTQASTIITITDDDTTTGANHPIFGTTFFVRQQYLDFLSREPEPNEPWSAILNNCANRFNLDPTSPSAACDCIIVSQSFFGSQEFRLKGFFVYLFYKVSYKRLPEYDEIVPDMRRVAGQTAEEVFAKRLDFADEWIARPGFSGYSAMSDAAYVDALLANVGASLATPDPDSGATRNSLVADLQAGRRTRAEVLRAIVETREVNGLEFNRAFVAMQYYGYLRRTPETTGYQAWLNYLNANPTDFRTMINGFLNSAEYRLRFGPVP